MSTYLEFETLKVEQKEKYVIVSLNRPDRMNTLNNKMKEELGNLFAQMEQDPAVFGVILTGEGRAFCAGSDVSQNQEGKGNPLITMRDYVSHSHDLYNRIEAFQRPVIAAINGFALGGGTELALVCDIRIASTAARFGLPEVNLGTIPCYGGTQRLPRLIGTGRAKEMMYTGRQVKADEALAMGLVNQVVEPEALLAAAQAKMAEIVGKAPISIKLVKLAVNKGMEMPLSYGLDLELEMVALTSATEDVREGGMAFFEKRTPQFKNK